MCLIIWVSFGVLSDGNGVPASRPSAVSTVDSSELDGSWMAPSVGRSKSRTPPEEGKAACRHRGLARLPYTASRFPPFAGGAPCRPKSEGRAARRWWTRSGRGGWRRKSWYGDDQVREARAQADTGRSGDAGDHSAKAGRARDSEPRSAAARDSESDEIGRAHV